VLPWSGRMTLGAILFLMFHRLTLIGLIAFPLVSAQAAGPQPPCETAPVPSYGTIDGIAAAGAWQDADLKRAGWHPPACLGWQGDSRMVAAIASRFKSPASLDELANRLTAVSHHPGIRFWAVTRQQGGR
jgi:hypothetical protein